MQVQQIILSRIGTSSDINEISKMKTIAEKRLAELKKSSTPVNLHNKNKTMPNLSAVQEISRVNSGIHDIVGSLYDELGFCDILDEKNKHILKLVVLSRFLEPSSKNKAVEVLEKRFGLDVSVDSIYRMMDDLYNKDDLVKQKVFESTISQTSSVDVMFFDVTTLHFETISEDELRKFGFSKNFRFNTTQVVLALATTKEGLPVGIKLFSGNTAEVTTLINCVQEWRKIIDIENAIVVGDRGMMSDSNLKQLESAGMQYVIAYPMKKSSKKIKQEILSSNNYTADVICNQLYWKKEINIGNNKRLIVTYSNKRHKNDAKQREKLINRISSKLGKSKAAKKLISNQGYLKYTEINGDIKAELNTEKIAEESQWDGLHGILTNSDLSSSKALARYKELWVIEESFRINKHTLKMRPIYHYTPQRIFAHILICYLTFALIRNIQHRLKINGLSYSVDMIRNELTEVQHSILCDNNTGLLYKMPSYMTNNATNLYSIFGKEKELSICEYGK
jgi:transposase